LIIILFSKSLPIVYKKGILNQIKNIKLQRIKKIRIIIYLTSDNNYNQILKKNFIFLVIKIGTKRFKIF